MLGKCLGNFVRVEILENFRGNFYEILNNICVKFGESLIKLLDILNKNHENW